MIRIRTFVLPLAAVLGAALPALASAQYYGGRHDGRYDAGPRIDTARVLEVDPILVPGEPTYRQQCWQEPVRYVTRDYAPAYDRYDTRYARGGGMGPNTRTVLGGIVGAAIGHQIGDGDGQRAATVAGALLGGAIARDANRQRAHDDRYGYSDRRGYGRGYEVQREETRYEQRCETVADGRSEDRVVGYRVRYDYNGHVGWTETAYHPGRTINVRVDITPEG